MTDQYYKVVLKGSQGGQTTVNTLYYKSEFEVTSDLFPHAGAEGLANNIKQEIWDASLKSLANEYFVLEEIQVTPYNSAFELIYQMPFTLGVNESGVRSGDAMPPSTCVNVHFNFKAVTAAQAPFVPRRGYVAIPAVSESVQVGGVLNDGIWNDPLNAYGKLAAKLTENIQELTPPAIWVPVRMKAAGGVGTALQKWVGAIEIQGAYVDRVLSNRKSRKKNS